MFNKKMIISETILTIAAVGQIILAILLYNPNKNELIINIGWGVLMLSAIFGWLPIFTFRMKGRVKGRGYMQTTILVDKGIYSIVRHPQYMAGVLLSIALFMITQHWSIAVLGLVAVVIYYLDTYDEEKRCTEKFGEAYKKYRERVPRMNFILGIVRLLHRTKE